MKYQKYPKYKDSGIEWIGEIPEHWDVTRTRWLFREINERSTNGDEVLLSVSEYYGVKPRKEIVDPGDFLTNAASLEGYKKCQKNDLVMNIMLAWKGALGITDYDGIVSPSYNVFRPLKPKDVNYLHNLFRTKVYADIFRINSTGIIDSRLRLYPDSFASVKVIHPPMEEQDLISKFLEIHLKRLDTLTLRHEKMIERLKEKRQAIITHAVTKGLDPNVPMKDSGIEWIGEMPQLWKFTKLKYLASKNEYSFVDGPFGSDLKNEEYQDIGIPLIQLNNISNGVHLLNDTKFVSEEKANSLFKHLIKPGDIVIAKMADPVARAAIVGRYYEKYVIVADCVKLVLEDQKASNRFINYAINSSVVRAFAETLSRGTTRLRINLSSIKELPILLPSLDEQLHITDYLDNITSNIDLAIAKLQKVISLLNEHKLSLVSEAVTGKIDVRGLIQEVKEPAGQTS